MKTHVQSYKLNPNENTVYTILERNGNKTLLQRHIEEYPLTDPTPFIVAYGLEIKENNIIEWDSGTYCPNLKSATNELENENQNIGKLLQISLIDKVENEWNDYRSRFINPDGTFIRHFQDHLYHRLHSDIHKSLIDISQNGELSLSQMIALIQSENVLTTIAQEYDGGNYGTTIKDAILGTADNAISFLEGKRNYPKASEKLSLFPLHEKSDNIEVDGYYGTWYVIDKIEYESKEYFLLEHEKYGDEAANIIVNNNADIVLDNVYNGFNDLFEFFRPTDLQQREEGIVQQGKNKSEKLSFFPPHEKSVVNKVYEPTKKQPPHIEKQHPNKVKEVTRDNSFTADISMV